MHAEAFQRNIELRNDIRRKYNVNGEFPGEHQADGQEHRGERGSFAFFDVEAYQKPVKSEDQNDGQEEAADQKEYLDESFEGDDPAPENRDVRNQVGRFLTRTGR